MWLFTKFGFYSIVTDKADPGLIQIRARNREDLEKLSQIFAARVPSWVAKKFEILDTPPPADYIARAIVPRSTWENRIAPILFESIDYPNFKNEIAAGQDYGRLSVYSRIWAILADYQIGRTFPRSAFEIEDDEDRLEHYLAQNPAALFEQAAIEAGFGDHLDQESIDDAKAYLEEPVAADDSSHDPCDKTHCKICFQTGTDPTAIAPHDDRIDVDFDLELASKPFPGTPRPFPGNRLLKGSRIWIRNPTAQAIPPKFVELLDFNDAQIFVKPTNGPPMWVGRDWLIKVEATAPLEELNRTPAGDADYQATISRIQAEEAAIRNVREGVIDDEGLAAGFTIEELQLIDRRARIDKAGPQVLATIGSAIARLNLPCPICNGVEGCDHTRTERARRKHGRELAGEFQAFGSVKADPEKVPEAYKTAVAGGSDPADPKEGSIDGE